ncbi:hypothetical protein MXB_614 [Myxobolus squamalis]|nr:hypothetical protein MXB_614 [Myxobolus squamalis]
MNVVKAAEKIAWIKSLNAGQICISIDYLIAHKSVANELMEEIIKFWKDIQSSVDYGRIVSIDHTKEEPLEIYVFTNLPEIVDQFKQKTISGGLTINECYIQMAGNHAASPIYRKFTKKGGGITDSKL